MWREPMARLVHGVNGGKIETLVEKLAAREMDVYQAAELLIDRC